MWSTFTCRATTSPVAATAARASSSWARRAGKPGATRLATVGGSAHAAGRRVALKAAAEGAATEETEDVIPRVEGEFVWDEDRPFHRCAPRRERGDRAGHPADLPDSPTRPRVFFSRHSHAKKSDVRASKHTFHGTKKISSARRLTPSYCPSFPSLIF
jgi:hypothetical protein